MPYIDMATVKTAVSVWRLLEDQGWTPYLASPVMRRGDCPMHGRGRPCIRIFAATTDWWRCYRCETYGDVIDLYAGIHAVSFPAALHALADRYCGAVPYYVASRRRRRGAGR